jgi:hypothetical protein
MNKKITEALGYRQQENDTPVKIVEEMAKVPVPRRQPEIDYAALAYQIRLDRERGGDE